MWDLKVCTVCLSAQGNLFNIDRCNLRIDYNLVSGLQTYEGNDLPGFLCVECTAYVKRCKSFRDKCQRAYFALQEILQQENEITPARIQAINRNSLSIMPSLAFSDPRRSKYETTEFTWTKRKRPSVSRIEDVTIMQCNTHEDKTCGTRPRKKPKLREKIKSESDDEGVKEELDNTFDSDDNYFGDFTQHNDDRNIPTDTDLKPGATGTEDQVEESTVDEEYATIVPISMTEAKAALEITKTYTIGKFKCEVCTRGFIKKNALETHARMHDKHLNGRFVCDLCDFYYKTELMLNSHMTEKHMFKYICKKCPVVHFERTTAKQHFIRSHLQERDKKSAGWYESKPAWVGGIRAKVPQVRGIAKSKASRGGKNSKGAARSKTALTAAPQGRPRSLQLPKDVIQVTPISPLDQYRLVRDRQYTSNYKTSPYQCEYCYRGYREYKTYNKHMQKHDEKVSGPLQCDMCKLHFRTPLQVYVHMATTHLHRYSCLKCEFVCYNRCQAITHYRWHKNVVYKCGQCDLVFKKASTRGTHIRLKHPSTDLCNICGHSFVSKSGLLNHLKKSHTREEVAKGKAARIDKTHGLYCSECEVQFLNDAAFSTHLGSSSKHSIINVPIQSKMRDTRVRRRKRPNNELVVNVGQPTGHDCEICGIPLPNDVKAREHYLSEHPGHEFLKRYMCDVCGHATKNYSNLEVHMRTHTHEKPYACTHCDRRFTMSSSRDRHLVVHTGERRYECEHCHRRFTQSNTLKLHIQTVHLKIPYAPWDKKNRKRRKEMEEPQSELKLMMMDAVNERIS